MNNEMKPVPQIPLLSYRGTPDSPDIKIFSSQRIDVDSKTIDNGIFIPVRCGAVYDTRENVTVLGDDTGDNISEKRICYSEMTVMYWAWKNVKADYYGLCHYRRYLAIDDELRGPHPQLLRVTGALTDASIHSFGLDDPEAVRRAFIPYDATFNYPEKQSSAPEERFSAGLRTYFLSSEAYDLLKVAVRTARPDCYDFFMQYLNSKTWRGYNHFVMKRELFFELCEFVFPVLSELEKHLDTEHYSSNQKRFCAYASELLVAAFAQKLHNDPALKVIDRQLILFCETARPQPLLPAFDRPAVPVVIPLTDRNRPLVSVTLCSIIEHSSPDVCYDIILLHHSPEINMGKNHLLEEEDRLLCSMAEGRENVSIRLYDPREELGLLDCTVLPEGRTEADYYLHILPWVMRSFRKVIYLREGMLPVTDIAALYAQTELSGASAAAVKDIHFSCCLNGVETRFAEKMRSHLGMRDLYNYVGTRIVVLNPEAILAGSSRDDTVNFILERIGTHSPEEIWNLLFEDKLLFLPQKWAAIRYPVTRVYDYSYTIPEAMEAERREQPCAFDLTSGGRNWIDSGTAAAALFWRYARKTVFYEQLLAELTACGREQSPAIDERSDIRKAADLFFPHGSRRRKLLKKLMPKKGSKGWLALKKIFYS